MVQVEIEDGLLEGELLSNEYGKPYYSFKGIPYAEPPIGELRFKPPKPIKPWKGVRPAKEFGSMCFQIDFFEPNPSLAGSEDCLYINVYSPDIKPSKPLPVMFWIHGGGYIWGSGNDNVYGPEFLVRHDVILVTFNYRLGFLGFLCLDTEDVPGNAGMKDQVLALKWVNKNISKFGGDPNNITIFGESAGGTSSSFHLVSPMSKGLFKRAIVQSGGITCHWASGSFQRERALTLARGLGFYSENDQELYDFFKKQPVQALITSKLPVTLSRKPYGELNVSVANEKDFGNNERFFYGDAHEWLRKGIHEGVEVLIGCVEHEGVIGISLSDFGTDVDKLFDHATNFVEIFVPKEIALEYPLIKQLDLGRKIKKFYFKNEKITGKDIDAMIDYINMDFFTFGTMTQAKYIARKNKTYVYAFTCKSERNQMTKVFGLGEYFKDKALVCHADDLGYLFTANIYQQKIDKSSKTFQLIDNVTKLWTNFAKFGNPTPDGSLGVKWTPFTNENQDYLDIGNELVAKNHPYKKDMEFWEGLYKECLPHRSIYAP